MYSRLARAFITSFKKASLYPFLLGTMMLQIFVCAVLFPALFLSDGPLCGERRGDGRLKTVGDRTVFDEDIGTSEKLNFAFRHPPVSRAETSSHFKAMTHKDHLSRTVRPFTILTTTNRGFLDFTANWILSIRRLKLQYNITIIAEDAEAYRYLTRNRTFDYQNLRIELTEYGFSHPKPQRFRYSGYRRLVNKRPQYLIDKLEEGFDTLMVDVDSFWFRDPLDFISPNYSKYDLWLAQGHDGKNGHRLPCPCLMYFKSNVISFGVVRHWMNRLLKAKGMESDQQSLNNVLKTRHGQRLRVGWLNKVNFPTGDDYKTRRENQEEMENVYIFHANHMGNFTVKKQIMKSYGLWIDSD
ncbi:UDP-D-xylose:L-fucose alpha-1,3-D-xylosyltransferase 1-like [Acanthaster planci]|uniref:UDP-D-xylose:L-fucose alpha-1,3-D-xylosyltransferase 1-like n=1 Tax=Acanthaster planci TaxID=133434 RepID=A0A8B7XWH4_ACAPL|nr:UDP-D-xylose:L-fucose alpha-1,3-D-xylosyltransferase 1-like [Acanthaster planci]